MSDLAKEFAQRGGEEDAQKDWWPHLSTSELKPRLYAVAGWLADKTHMRYVLDLDCGDAALYDHLHPNFAKYIATDKRSMKFPRMSQFTFLRLTDDQVVGHKQIPRVDILVVMGYAAHLNERESDTLPDSIRAIVAHYAPAYIAVDAWARLPAECLVRNTVARLVGYGYNVEHALRVMPMASDVGGFANRQIYLLQRRHDE